MGISSVAMSDELFTVLPRLRVCNLSQNAMLKTMAIGNYSAAAPCVLEQIILERNNFTSVPSKFLLPCGRTLRELSFAYNVITRYDALEGQFPALERLCVIDWRR